MASSKLNAQVMVGVPELKPQAKVQGHVEASALVFINDVCADQIRERRPRQAPARDWSEQGWDAAEVRLDLVLTQAARLAFIWEQIL